MIIQGAFKERISDTLFLYASREPFFSVFGGKQKTFLVSGDNLPSYENVFCEFAGHWKKDEFLAESIKIPEPTFWADEVSFLHEVCKTDIATTGLLSNVFRDDLLKVLHQNVNIALEQIETKEWKKRKFKRNWLKYKYAELFSYLQEFEIEDAQVVKIIDAYKCPEDEVRRNPYLLPQLCNIPFHTADLIAVDNGISWSSDLRVGAAISSALQTFESGNLAAAKDPATGRFIREIGIQTGSTCATMKEILPLAQFFLGDEHEVGPEKINQVLNEGIKNNDFVELDGLISRGEVGAMEERTAKNIFRLQQNHRRDINMSSSKIMRKMDEIVKKAGLAGPLSRKQAEAVALALQNPVSIITGGPGTGKTTIQSAILYLLNKKLGSPEILMLAPTGRAASRMTESSGYPAQTIHSALGIDIDGHSATKKIEADVVLIDEFSMVDSSLADQLFSSIKEGTKVLCIGDVNQLPSVGAGAVLREMIESNAVPTARLTEVFRQKNGSPIADNAYAVNEGRSDLSYDETFIFKELPGKDIAPYVVESYLKQVDELGIDNVCILTPFRKETDTGVNHLNKVIQEKLHERYTGKRLSHFGIEYLVGDKVMYRKNKNGLTNGDIGYVEEVSDESLTVKFGEKQVVLNENDLNDLDLAYAVTIHKSQGSEYKSVILVMDPKHKSMNKRNLIYTAITRAKERILLVGEKRTLERGVQKEETKVRKSLLGARLKTELSSELKK